MNPSEMFYIAVIQNSDRLLPIVYGPYLSEEEAAEFIEDFGENDRLTNYPDLNEYEYENLVWADRFWEVEELHRSHWLYKFLKELE